MKKKVVILKNESSRDHLLWVKACEEFSDQITFDVIEFTHNDWFEKIQAKEYDLYLLRAPGQTSLFKQLYDERTYILSEVLKKTVYPSFKEVLIYENKRFLSYWLKANSIPAPQTSVFYNKKEVQEYAQSTSYPVVLKTNIGASGKGIKIAKDIKSFNDYIEQAFSKKGIQSFKRPKLFKGNIIEKLRKVLFNKGFIQTRMKEYEEYEERNS